MLNSSSLALQRILLPFYRAFSLARYMQPTMRAGWNWLLNSRETTNFTYDLSPKNLDYLCSVLSLVTNHPAGDYARYIAEAQSDEDLRSHVLSATAKSDWAFKADRAVKLHKRLGWYALVRATKPRVVVETGVDKGLGAVVLCAAILRNRQEGHEGRYFGTDINSNAGYLLCGLYKEAGKILYGDSIDSLRRMQNKIGVFVNDSDHSASYELEEYNTILPLLLPDSVILGDNAHATSSLYDFSKANNRDFLFWKEEPLNHWYPGGGIGFSFNRQRPQAC
jgi:predicted O-methyltransferase YrrM